MKRRERIKRVERALVALFLVFLGFWLGRCGLEWREQRQFAQAVRAFDADETYFTIYWNSDCQPSKSISSAQLTYQQKVIVEQYVHSLRAQKMGDFRTVGGGVSIQYWLPSGRTMSAGKISYLELGRGRFRYFSCQSDQDSAFYELLEEIQSPDARLLPNP